MEEDFTIDVLILFLWLRYFHHAVSSFFYFFLFLSYYCQEEGFIHEFVDDVFFSHIRVGSSPKWTYIHSLRNVIHDVIRGRKGIKACTDIRMIRRKGS